MAVRKWLLLTGVLALSMAAFGQPGPGGPGFGGPAPGGMAAETDDPKAIQKKIGATNEEWMVIWAKLQKITQLRAQVSATASDGDAPMAGGMMLGAPGMPGGGDSLEAPDPQAGGGPPGGMPGGMFGGNSAGPFATPPAPKKMGFGGFGGPGFGNMLITGQDNPVQSLLSDLPKLISNPSTPADQLREKLQAIRATRNKAKADLQAAETDVMQLLTTRQIATLVLLNYLD